MEYNSFLNQIINDGIEAAKEDYKNENDKNNLEGSIAGFLACKNLNTSQLMDLFQKANKEMNIAFFEQKNNYWYFKCYQGEVEWVCNVLSAVLIIQGEQPLLSYLPTTNGMRKAIEICGSSGCIGMKILNN